MNRAAVSSEPDGYEVGSTITEDKQDIKLLNLLVPMGMQLPSPGYSITLRAGFIYYYN